LIAAPLGPPAHYRYQPTANTLTAVIGMNVDLFEMGNIRLTNLDMSEPDGHISVERYPQTTIPSCLSQFLLGRRFVENRFGSVAPQQLCGGELYASDELNIAQPRANDLIGRHPAATCLRAPSASPHERCIDDCADISEQHGRAVRFASSDRDLNGVEQSEHLTPLIVSVSVTVSLMLSLPLGDVGKERPHLVTNRH
jgi:hypothetical protein